MRNNKIEDAKKSISFSFLAVINEPRYWARDIRYGAASLAHKYNTVCKSTITGIVTKTNYGATKDRFIIKRCERDKSTTNIK